MNNYPEIVTLIDKKFKVYISPQEIDDKISIIADSINSDYKDKSPVFLTILNGAVVFATDLLRKINLDCEIEFLSAKSYGNAMQTSGKVDLKHYGLNLKDRDVIIVEDIVDTGHTMTKLYENLKQYEPKSIKSASLLSKPAMRQVEVKVHYLGFEIEPVFVVGYGLDYASKGRQLPAIYKLID